MKKAKSYIYWALYLWYIYIFGYAGIFKIINVKSMIEGMDAFGFNLFWTHAIGWAEFLGTIGLIIGFWKPFIRNLSILWLFPFAIGAFTAHMAHQEYHHFFNSFAVTLLSYVLLALDENFKIVIGPVSKTEV